MLQNSDYYRELECPRPSLGNQDLHDDQHQKREANSPLPHTPPGVELQRGMALALKLGIPLETINVEKHELLVSECAVSFFWGVPANCHVFAGKGGTICLCTGAGIKDHEIGRAHV